MMKMITEQKYRILYDDNFTKELDKLSGEHQKLVLKKLLRLRSNPFHPSLRTKKMQGGFGNYESSVNMDIRIIWRFRQGKIIALIDVGHHDVLKKY